jgi:signal transduction histidine kinase
MPAEHKGGWQGLGLELAAQLPVLSTVLKLLVTKIEQSLGPAPVMVYLYDSDSGHYELHQASQGVESEDALLSIPCDGTLVRWLERCPDLIGAWPNQGQGPAQDLHSGEQKLLERLGQALFLPLRSWSLSAATGRELCGWVAVGSRSSGQPYTPADWDVLTAVVSQAALGLENVRLHRAVREAEEGRSEFIDFVAHELKQPMTAIQGYAKMLTLGIGGEPTDTQRQFAEVISANAERMGRLVNNLLEVSRLEAGRITLTLAPTDLGEILGEAIAAARAEIEARHHTLVVDIPADLPPALTDRDRLLQILSNLISNAYKYTPEGGHLQITAEPLAEPGEPAAQLLISMSDSGIGMSGPEVARAGEKFFRASHELVRTQPGSGLGISIVQQLITLHGGQLTVQSEPDRGSTFRFTLPTANEQPG